MALASPLLSPPSRWSLSQGGFSCSTSEDEDGKTALEIAATLGKAKAMQVIVDYLRRLHEEETINTPFEGGRTALMMASYGVRVLCLSPAFLYMLRSIINVAARSVL